MENLDVLVIHPGGREKLYQQLAANLAAVEPPLWSRLIAGYVRDRGFSVDILDTEALELGAQSTAKVVADRKPALVAMVVFGHQPSASTQMMVGAGDACREIKAASPETPILIMGGHVSALPERTLREEAVDFACKGEGPITVCQLVSALRETPYEHIDFATIPGLVWSQDEGDIVVNAEAPLIQDLDQDLHGMVWDLLPMERYRAHNWQCFGDEPSRTPYASIYTSLGCPYKCSFCCINAPFGGNIYRLRAPERVVAEVDFLYRTYGVKTFKIIDEMFVLNERHVLAICEGLARLDYADDLNFWAYSRVDTVKPRMLKALRAAGVRWLALGIESGSAHVRDGSNKRLRGDDILSIVAGIQAEDINVLGNFIFGLPDDTLETMRETLELAKTLNCEFANFYSAMAYPGSRLYDTALEEGWPLPEEWSGFSQHSYDCRPLPTQTLDAEDVLAFRDEAFDEYFAGDRYLKMFTQRFGAAARRQIMEMTSHRLRRKILEDRAAGTDVRSEATS